MPTWAVDANVELVEQRLSLGRHGLPVEPAQRSLHELAAEKHVHVDRLRVRERKVLEDGLDPWLRASRIHPAILAEGGLGPALKTLARRSRLPVELEVRVEMRLREWITETRPGPDQAAPLASTRG